MAAETKSVVRTESAPAPFQGAPYSQAIRSGGFVFVSGQLGVKPGDTEISGGIEEQTEQTFANLEAILEEAGTGLDRLVKTTVFRRARPWRSRRFPPERGSRSRRSRSSSRVARARADGRPHPATGGGARADRRRRRLHR